MAHPVTAVILAGGASARMGRNKALVEVGGRTILSRQIEVLRPRFERLLIGSNDPAPYRESGLEVVPDVLRERCALTGIHAALAAAATGHVFVVACDLPFLSGPLIDDLVARCEGADAVVPESDRGMEPMHAVYSRACRSALESAAGRGEWKATGFLRELRVDRWRVRDADWSVEGRSPFLNVNTPGELEAAGP